MPDLENRRRARRGLAVYLGLTLAISAGIQGWMIAIGAPIDELPLQVILLMWTPTVAMIVTRLVLREGVRDVSFRLGAKDGGWRAYLVAWLFPVAVGLLAYGAAWLAGLAPFAVPERIAEAVGPSPALALAYSLGTTLTLVTVLSAITATGEELGWRGYMMTRLVDAQVPRPALVSGMIWGLWHCPLILSGQYAAGPSPVLSAVLFFIGISGQGYLYAYVRLRSGSVWPAVLAHSAWNAVIQGTFDPFADQGSSHAGTIWVGEAGVFVVVVALALVAALVWRPFPLRRFPGDPGEGEGSLRTL